MHGLILCASTVQPPKRGLSLEEKRTKLLEVFHESKDVFALKVIIRRTSTNIPLTSSLAMAKLLVSFAM